MNDPAGDPCVPTTFDLVVVGGGIVGCSAAAIAAERGASVLLVEAEAVGAGASGRNSGAVQHPFDAVLAELHVETLAIYRELAATSPDFGFPDHPAGLLLLTDDQAGARSRADELAAAYPALAPEVLDADELRRREPIVGPGLSALRLETGHPIPPDAATAAMAARAAAAGAKLRVGDGAASLVLAGDRVTGVRLGSGTSVAGGAVLAAAGPWTPDLVDASGTWRPLRPTYGVTVQVAMRRSARHVLEEGAVHTVNRPVDEVTGAELPSTFSMVSVGEVSTVGSTFLPTAPNPDAVGQVLVSRGTRFVPALAAATIVRARVCTRPQSVDGRPFIGSLPGVSGLFTCVGHGPWGISTGPASARLVVDAILTGDEQHIAPELRAARAAGPFT
jgi:glycine/D-amino acid oxidase-like deaminating enzyme